MNPKLIYHLKNIFEISYIIKHKLILGLMNATLRNSSKRNENIRLHKDLNVNIHSIFIYNIKKKT